MTKDLSKISDADLMKAAGVAPQSKVAGMSDEALAKIAGVSLNKQPSKLKQFGKKVLDEVGGIGEFVGNTIGTAGTLLMDAGHFGGAVVDSIVQEDLSRENFERNMERRAKSTEPLRNALVQQPTTQRGQAMIQTRDEGLAVPGQVVHQGIMDWGKSIGADEREVAQLAGVGSVAADIAPFVLMERGISGMKPKTPPLTGKGIRPGIARANPLDQHTRVMTSLEKRRQSQTKPSAETTEIQPNLIDVESTTKPREMTLEEWNKEFAQERVDKQVEVREAIAKDDIAMANEMAAGRENPLITNILGERSRKLQDLEQQQPGLFNHDVTDGIPAKDNLQVSPTVKPVIKATASEFIEMRQQGLVSPDTHVSFFPEGPGPDKPVYLINKEAGLDLNAVKNELASGNESSLLGYPERSPNPVENKTAAVTKEGEVLTNPEEIIVAKEQGELQWAAEGRPEEVLAKAEAVVENGSGESAASLEAQSRLKSEQGDRFYKVENGVVRNEIPATVDRVDTFATKPSEAIIRVKPDGTMEKVSGEGRLPKEVPVPKEARTEKVGEYELPIEEPLQDNFADFKETKRSGYKGSTTIQAQRMIYALKKAGIPRGDFSVKTKMTARGEYGDAHASFKGSSQKLIKEHESGLLDAGFDIRLDMWEDGTTHLSIDQPKFEGRGKVIVHDYVEKTFGLGDDTFVRTVPQKRGEYKSLSEAIPEPSSEIKTSQIEAQASETPSMLDSITENTLIDMNLGITPKVAVKALDAVVDGFKQIVGEIATYGMKDTVRSIFREPQFVAEWMPGFREIYRSLQERIETKEAIQYDLYESEFGVEGVRDLYRMNKELPAVDKADFSEIIRIQDKENRNFTADELRNGQNPLGRPVSEGVIQLHGATERIMQKFAKILLDKMYDLILLPYKNEPYFRDLMQVLDDGVSAKEYARSEWADRDVASALADVQHNIKTWENIKESVEKNPGYMFRHRPYGEQHVRIYEIDSFGQEHEVYMRPAANVITAKYRKSQIEKGLNPDGTVKDPARLKKFLKSNLKEDGRYIVDYDFNPNMQEEILVYSGSQASKASVFDHVIEKLKDRGVVDSSISREIARQALNELTDVYRSRGYGSKFMKRKQEYIEGFDTNDYIKTITGNVSSMAGWLSKSEYAIKAMAELKNVPPEYQAWVNGQVRKSLTNTNPTAAAVGGTARTVKALSTLAYKVVSPFINGTAHWIMGIPEMNHRLRKMGLPEQADKAIHKTIAEIGLQAMAERKGTNYFDAEIIKARDAFSRIGGDKAQLTREVAGLDNPGLIKGLNKVTEIGMTPFSKVEQVFNREVSFISMFRYLREKGMDYNTAFEQARDYSLTTHGDMTKYNLPRVFQNEVGRTVMSLQRYSMHYANWMINRAFIDKSYQPVVRSLATVGALGGLGALGLGQVDKLLARTMGISPKLLLKKYVYSEGKDKGMSEENVDKLYKFIEYGLPAVGGVNLSRNLELQAPFLSNLVSGEPVSEAVLGSWASNVKNARSAMKALKSGQNMRAFEILLPVQALSNVLAAYRMKQEGAYSVTGKPTLDKKGEPIVLKASEAILKALGVNPTRLAEAQDLREATRGIENYFRKRAETLSILKRRAEMDDNYMEEFERETEAFNRDASLYEDLIAEKNTIIRPRRDRQEERRQDFFENLEK